MSKRRYDSKGGLLKGSIIYGIGNIGTLVINFFLVPLYTFYLTNDELGYFDLVASSIIILSPIFFGHIELAVIRWLLASEKVLVKTRVVSNCCFIFICGSLIFTALFLLINYFVTFELAYFIYLYLISNFFYIIAKQVIRSVYSAKHYIFSELFYTLLVLIITLFLVEKYSLKAIFFAYLIASIVLLGYLLGLRIFKYFKLRAISRKLTFELLAYSSPLVLNTLSLWLNNQSGKYLIATYLTLSSNGIYAIAFKIAYVIQILNRIFYLSFQDKIFRVYKNEGFSEYFSETLEKYCSIIFSLWFLMIGSQKLVLPFIIEHEFLGAVNYIPYLGLGVVFMSLSSVLGIIYQCEKKNINAFKTSMVSGITIVLMSLIFIPYFGLYGAVVSFTVGNLIWLVYRFKDVQKFTSISIRLEKIVMYIVLGLILTIITINHNPLNLILGSVLAIAISIYCNHHLIKSNFNVLISKLKSGTKRK
ncbi:polysaccharide biosynthesis C-terminal domain-containing protein [Maribacter litopenaei]|uniref:Polysaccharide biosynthesis C-terminal domain-containing protein n=1 Tax=Maribacter litopenaei TaxID=2976127 RepID=A0ABY5Y7J8_9FLAO|nr:polysaccharide biosynthesis C-terminal domain-containing protein [Maribacter litopenaei]UWX55003.1 polysaccharide biosynthesis C-terminal domain-containing protein [Maribacter litopenaei]